MQMNLASPMFSEEPEAAYSCHYWIVGSEMEVWLLHELGLNAVAHFNRNNPAQGCYTVVKALSDWNNRAIHRPVACDLCDLWTNLGQDRDEFCRTIREIPPIELSRLRQWQEASNELERHESGEVAIA